jgi:hypothetical protein
VIIEPASKASKAVWRRVGRWSRLTWVIRIVSAIITVAVAVLLEGDVPRWNANAALGVVRNLPAAGARSPGVSGRSAIEIRVAAIPRSGPR